MTIDNESSSDQVIDSIKNKDYEGLRDVVYLNINKGYSDGWTLLHYASESDDAQLLEIISSHPMINLNSRTSSKLWTPLMVAASLGNSKALNYLIKKGADVSCVTDDGVSALMLAAKSNSLECVKVLLEANNNLVKLQDSNGMNALMYGVGESAIVGLSDISQVDENGKNVLHFASESNLDTVKLI